MKTILPFLIVIFSLMTFNVKAQEEVTLPPTVVDVALGDENFSSLVAALTRGDLTVDFVTALSGEGPFTVFAPTNDAFTALLSELGLSSLAEIPVATLEAVLQMHVIPAKVMSTDLSEGLTAATLFGENLMFSLEGGAKIMDPNYRVSNITAVDVETENGVVHVIDKVILPDVRPETVVDIVTGDENFSILEEALTRDDLGFDFIGMLNGTDPVSVFAPTNDAFMALLAALGAESLDDIDAPTLEKVLKLHIIAGEVMSSDISNFYKVKTILGESLRFNTDDGAKVLDPAGGMSNISVIDLLAMNGVVHGIDAVLLPAKTTVVDIIVESDDHTTLEAAVVAAGLVETLQGDGPFTVFAPTDAAFAALPEGTLEALLADPSGQLTDILLYHVVNAKAMSGDLSDGQVIETAFGQYVTVSITSEGVYINDAMVTVADVVADNGVVHVIDAVLVPTTKTVVDIVVESENHETLEAAVIAAGLVETLQGEGPFTVFAPTDDAFAALPEGTLDTLLADPSGLLTDILLYHVVMGKAMSGDLSDGQMIETAFGEDITVSITSEGVYINDAMVTVADVVASNGVVHVIDAVLVPAGPSVVDIIVDSENHETLEAAVIAAGLVETLQGEGPFTVFAPTDEAFAALPEGTLEALLADPSGLLTDILLYHVVMAKAMSGDLSDGQMIETALGQYVTVSITSEGVFINGAQVTVADVVASNGVVHVIDAVLVPTTKTVVDIVVESENHETLEAAVIAAGLVETLQGEGPFTVFAPTDEAFAALPEGTLEALLADPSGLLTDILLYHVVGAKAFSGDLSDGQMIETVLGKDIRVRISSKGVYINDAMVTVADIEATNGVVHVIDAVLVPAKDVQIAENENYGQILTDAFGYSLYFFTKDADGSSMCTEGCLTNWPIFYSEDMDFGEGLEPGDFATIDRGDGVMQTTYKGWPLYYFVKDMEPGQAIGEGVNGKWFVAKPDYTIMLIDDQLTGKDSIDYKGDYTPGSEMVQYFTDAKGITLYTWTKDNYNKNNFTDADFNKNPIWPVYEEENIVVPSTLNPSDFGVIDVHGKKQMTYKGWPLYYFGDDMMMRGENKGVSVPAPGIWPVAVQDMMSPKFPTVVDIVVQSEAHNTLEAAVIAAGLVETLQGEGPFTVFAPTDSAFAALPEGLLDTLLADPSGMLTDILLYHVVNGNAMSGDLSDGQMIETALGQYVTVKITSEGVYINDAMVTVADIVADNGVVHVIDAVLVPTTKTVVDIVVESENHETLEAAVIAAGLVETLQGEGPFTVFAPTDSAFAALPEGTLEALLADPSGLLTDILLYHVVNGKAMSGDLADGQMIETALGKSVTVSITSEGVYINEAMVTVADIQASNGVVHVIDAVLVPEEKTVVDIIVDSENHETLEAAVIAAGLVETLQGEGPFTVFAPTDSAFAALPEGLLDTLLADPSGMLTDILLYHVVNGNAMSGDLSDGQMIETALGQYVMVEITSEGVYINDAMVTVADVVADNGVVHVIDAVLVPTTKTVVDIVVESENHTTLEAAVIAAGLVETLQGEGPFTVFAPTDSAFAALPEGILDTLLADPSGMLTDILLYHVVMGKAMSGDLSDGQMIETALGKNVTVSITSEGVYINDAMVTVADIQASNGVVHVIDAVLVPEEKTVVDIIVDSENHETLEAAVIAAGLVETLQGDGPFTVFAPTDAAFAALPEGTLDTLLADPSGMLTDILLYHVVNGKAMSGDLSDGQMIETALGQYVMVKITSEGVYINDAMVTVADVVADNGVVHVIDAVLVPSTKTVVDIVVESENHTILESAVIAAGLVEPLQGEGPFTVFAPTDDAFAALLTELGVDSLGAIPAETLEAVLLMHVISAKVMSGDLSEGMMAETLYGENLKFSVVNGVVIMDMNGRESNVTAADLEAVNGVVHVIDKVILPDMRPETVVDIATGNEDFSILVEALTREDLGFDFIGLLTGDGPVSVFAPTNDAFMALLAELGAESLDDIDAQTLEAVLKLHIVAGNVVSSKISNYYAAKTVLGQKLRFNTDDGAKVLDPAGRMSNISVVDLLAKNGVVHAIDAVLLPELLPEETTVVDIIVESEDHMTLEAAVIAAGLVETLQGDGPFTVFAPTDDAFAALPEGTLEALLADPSGQLTDILLYHVVNGKAMSGDLSDGQMIETAFGQYVTVSITSEGVFINDAMVTVADVVADNGVVHVIDAVLVPTTKTVVDIIVESENHETLEAAVIAADLVETLQGDGPFTVFAPTDSAFAALPEGTLEALLADPSGQLTDILLYHVVNGKAMSGDLSDGQMIQTALGEDVTVSITSEGVFINGAMVTVADIQASNGVVHVIDAVLVPEEKSAIVNLPGLSEAVTDVDDLYQAEIKIFPNPTSDFINIRSNSRDLEVRIMNVSGTVIYNKVMSSETEQIDVRSYVPGLYLVNVRDGQNVSTARVIVQ